MNLMQVIHERWAEATALNALLPAERVFTGASHHASLPLAVITKESDKPDSYATDGSAIDIVALRIRVLHAEHDPAAAIIHQIKKTFDRSTFNLADSDVVQLMQRVNDFEQHRDDGSWEMVIDFQCTVFLAAGA